MEVDGRLFGLHEKFAHPADPEAVIRRLLVPLDLHRVLADHIPVLFRLAGGVAHVPTDQLEEGVEEIDPDLGLLVGECLVGGQIGAEALAELRKGGFGLFRGFDWGHGTLLRHGMGLPLYTTDYGL